MKTFKIKEKSIAFKRKLFVSAFILFVVVIFSTGFFLTIQSKKQDFSLFIAPILTFAYFSFRVYKISENYKKHENQFIEWTQEKIIYKLKTELKPKEILISEIKNISIHIDSIEITTKDQNSCILDISDFQKYEERKQIKANFEAQKNLIL